MSSLQKDQANVSMGFSYVSGWWRVNFFCRGTTCRKRTVGVADHESSLKRHQWKMGVEGIEGKR